MLIYLDNYHTFHIFIIKFFQVLMDLVMIQLQLFLDHTTLQVQQHMF